MVEWLKVKALSSSPSTEKKKKALGRTLKCSLDVSVLLPPHPSTYISPRKLQSKYFLKYLSEGWSLH
jgi:hypothetical protein